VRNTLDRDGRVEHTAEGDTNNIARMDAKADDAPSELIHDNAHSMALQKNGLTPSRSMLQRLFFARPRRVNHDGPPSSGIGW
jgi:hypothetical protein